MEINKLTKESHETKIDLNDKIEIKSLGDQRLKELHIGIKYKMDKHS